jgi:hypothetical protein
MAMAEALERDLYNGGDLYIRSDGSIDPTIASQINGPVRQIRGIQANVREGDTDIRGIPGDFIGFGNNRSVVFDRKGGVLERAFLDRIVTAVRDSRGAIKEGHCTTSQLAEFRATFFPIERANLNERYAINGAAVTNDEHARFPVDTVAGVIDFIPTVFKYERFRPLLIQGSGGQTSGQPVLSGIASGGVVNGGSGFIAGQEYRYIVEAVSIHGTSNPSAAATYTVVTNDDSITFIITPAAGTPRPEHFRIFRTPKESDGAAGTEFYIGKATLLPGAATVVFRDNNKVIPGLDSILFLPRDKNRPQLAVLGNLLNKLQLGVKGLAFETVYASYVGCVVDRPRSYAISDNVFQVREGL